MARQHSLTDFKNRARTSPNTHKCTVDWSENHQKQSRVHTPVGLASDLYLGTKERKMGLSFTKLFSLLFAKKEMKILFVGLEAAGKTTILYKLKLGEIVKTVATIGFTVETMEYKDINFIAWDLGAYQDELRDTVLLVYANKQDLPYAMNATEITEKLDLHSVRQSHWHIESTCATSGEGLYEGLEWLYNTISKKQ
ncbi:hypothetical protein RJ639_027395 [Escallonia herrerae]|uniref:ADP-ribosylation factor 1 n=1 Tax=Escallonia herrerae TaxID=1293975 RepID=A0AA88X2Q4_9ASTE|nr:hypothetical protein RJ639_027395 [Escallonia herrerae]